MQPSIIADASKHAEIIKNKIAFKNELEILINKYSIENGSNTPDFILTNYLISCLNNFEDAIIQRIRFKNNESLPEFLREEENDNKK